VLIAILMPALSAARRHALKVKCQSNLRQIATSFYLYAYDNRGYWPVCKWEVPNPPIPGTNITALYWGDYIGRYVGKAAQNTANIGNSFDFAEARKTILWGCPNWQGVSSGALGFDQDGVSVYENGYAMNIYPTYQPLYPKPIGVAVPVSEWAIWSPTQNGLSGKWYKQNAWTKASERALVMDSYLWLLQFYPASTVALIHAQYVGRTPDYNSGGSTIDRYRHGKLPGISPGNVFDKYGGQVGFNVAFCDGHVEGLKSIADGFKAIRMRGF